jgi:nucleoside-diphosphate kinase
VLARLSETKLDIVAAKIVKVSKELAAAHYCQLKDKPFFEELIKYIMGDYHKHKVMALVYHGENAIGKVRQICGATNPEEADPVSIRGAYGRITTKGVYENVIHASTNREEAEREIKLWFEPSDIIVDVYPAKQTEIKSLKKTVWA